MARDTSVAVRVNASRRAAFQRAVLDWFDQHGRKDLPWQQQKSAYGVWLSEIMLQQTQVATVRDYYARFRARFPDVQTLAAAPLDDVLTLWAGLGYYARARNLHRAAQTVVQEHGGEFPRDVAALMSLPGVGRSTAGAIASSAYQIHAPILDGNVKRVLSRVFGVSQSTQPARAAEQQLWQLSDELTPAERVADYNQAMMDLGATLCRARAPECVRCPLAAHCVARAENDFLRYPGRKPPKLLPVRQARVLWLGNADGAVLLQQRPPTGIWGGLWWLPEIDPALSPGESAEQCGVIASEFRALPALRHSFSHFHLDIHTYVALKPTPACRIMDSSRRWQPLSALDQLGVPAPLLRVHDAVHC